MPGCSAGRGKPFTIVDPGAGEEEGGQEGKVLINDYDYDHGYDDHDDYDDHDYDDHD